MNKHIALILLVGFVVTMVGPTTVEANPAGNKAEILFKVVTKLMAKGDEAIVGLGRVLKAETYLKRLDQPDKALVELAKLESELTDPELLFAVNAIRLVVMKEAEKDPNRYIEGVDRIIAAAKERMSD